MDWKKFQELAPVQAAEWPAICKQIADTGYGHPAPPEDWEYAFRSSYARASMETGAGAAMYYWSDGRWRWHEDLLDWVRRHIDSTLLPAPGELPLRPGQKVGNFICFRCGGEKTIFGGEYQMGPGEYRPDRRRWVCHGCLRDLASAEVDRIEQAGTGHLPLPEES